MEGLRVCIYPEQILMPLPSLPYEYWFLFEWIPLSCSEGLQLESNPFQCINFISVVSELNGSKAKTPLSTEARVDHPRR